MLKNLLQSLFVVVILALAVTARAQSPSYRTWPVLTAETLAVFNDMPEADKLKFLTKRNQFLNLAEKSFGKIKPVMGPISVFKSKRQLETLANASAQIERVAYSYDDGTRADILASLALQELQLESNYLERSQKNSEQLSQEIIDSVIRALDLKLWQQAPIIANSNEFGVLVAAGPVALAGRPNTGKGGAIDFGLSVGYNSEERSLAIQLFTGIEKYQTTLMPAVFMAGAVGKLGIYFSQQKESLSSVGNSFYPAMIPGFTSKTPTFFATGFSTGITAPPSPLGDAMTYENSLSRKILIRLTISPFTKGFVRIRSLLNHSSLNFALLPIRNFIGGKKTTCSSLFN